MSRDCFEKCFVAHFFSIMIAIVVNVTCPVMTSCMVVLLYSAMLITLQVLHYMYIVVGYEKRDLFVQKLIFRYVAK